MRTIIDLPDDQITALDEVCEIEGISRAEAVRQAVAGHLQRRRKPGAERAFGLWRGQGIDSVRRQRRLRSEWSVRDRHR